MKNPILHIFLFLYFFPAVVSGQATVEEIDSLKKALSDAADAREKADIMCYLGDAYETRNIDSAILYLRGALQVAEKLRDLAFTSRVYCLLGQVYQNEDRVKSTEYILKALDFAEHSGDSSQIAYTYNIVGSHYRVSGELDKAIPFFDKAILIRKAQRDSASIAVCYNNLGIVYMMQGEYDQGLDYWQQSLNLKLAVGDSIAAAHSMCNIAIYYKDIGRILEALDYTNDAILIELRNGDLRGVTHGYLLLGEIYLKTENYPKAIASYKLSLEYADSIKSEYEKMEPLYGIAMAYKRSGNYEEATYALEDYCRLYQKFNDENTGRISKELGTKYETEKKEKENLLLKNQNVTKDLELKEEEARTLFLLIGLSLAMAMIVVIFLALRRVRQAKLQVEEQKHIVEEKNKEITDSINYAKRIQAAILPPLRIVKQNLPESFILYKPKDIVACDFYWLEKTKDVLLLAAADCTGHGVPGAMVSVICNNGLNRAVREHGLNDPGKILDKTREIVISEFEKSDDEVKDGMDISLVGFYHNKQVAGVSKTVVEWAGANNPLWVIRKGTKEIQEIKADKQPIGKFSEAKPFTSHALSLDKGDSLYIFTDGYQDQFGGEKGKKFKAASLRNLLLENVDKPMAEQQKILETSFDQWKGNFEQVDDVCLIGVRL